MANGGIGAGLPAPDASSKKLKVKEFLTSGSWVRPAGVDVVEILLVGGGGGAGGIGHTSGAASGSGGGGGVVKKLVDVTSIPVNTSVAVTIGSGGAGGSTSGTAGGVGGSSIFGSLLTVLGGGGGDGYPTASGVTTGIATQGGGSNAIGSAVYTLPGLGAGAGGSPRLGVLSTATQAAVQQYRSASSGVLNGVSVQSGNTTLQAFLPPIAGSAYLGFGAGGGCSSFSVVLIPSVAGDFGAGTMSNQNALPNTGGGGAGSVESSASSVARAGGNGGSGYALITWWE